jgi:hypothetical protein
MDVHVYSHYDVIKHMLSKPILHSWTNEAVINPIECLDIITVIEILGILQNGTGQSRTHDLSILIAIAYWWTNAPVVHFYPTLNLITLVKR